MYNTVFKLSSEITFNTATPHLEALTQFVNQSKSEIISIDLSAVTQCDSAGLALLIEITRLCKQQQKKLIIEHMPKTVEALAEFCGVSPLLAKLSAQEK